MKWIHVSWVDSDSEPGKQHEIKKHPSTGRLGCACKEFQFSRGEKTCHHLRAHNLAVAQDLVLPAHAERPAARRVTVGGQDFTVRRAIAFGAVPAAAPVEANDPLEVILPKRDRDRLRALAARRRVSETDCLREIVVQALAGRESR